MAVDGKWKFTINSPMGAQGGTIDIKTSGDSLTGDVQSAVGAMQVSGKVAGSKLTWRLPITQPMPMMKMAMAEAADTPVAPGESSLSASVNVVAPCWLNRSLVITWMVCGVSCRGWMNLDEEAMSSL